MNERLIFNGINSADYGVYISGDAVYNAPERSVEMVSIPGRNGNLAIDNGRFENITVQYPAFCWAENQSDFAAKLSDFRNAILSAVGYQRLEDDYHPDEYRQAVYKAGLNVDPTQYNRAGEFTIEFDAKPQRFLVSGETATIFTGAGTVTNPTRFASSPMLTVTGTGTVGVGAYSFTLQGSAGQVVYIDCEIMEAWTLSGGVRVPANDLIQYAGNEFPKLQPGANGIALGSGITRIEVVPRWFKI